MIKNLKKLVSLNNPLRLLYHKIRAIIANIYYNFPSKNMVIIWVTWTNWKTTTCNIIAKWLEQTWKKVFMFSTVNIILDWKEYTNNTKMTSPDVFDLQRLLKKAKKAWAEIAIIETASHWIKMNRIWWLEYDFLALTNISQDHLDLHKTMDDYVKTKLTIFKKLITYNRKNNTKKIAILNSESDYIDLFMAETYDNMYTYWKNWSCNIKAENINHTIKWINFDIKFSWKNIPIQSKLRWDYNVENLLAAIWIFISFGIKTDEITKVIKTIEWIPWRMEEVKNLESLNIFIDYAHTPDALEKVLQYLESLKNTWRIITVFGATWDRDKLKRPIMGQIVSKLSDLVILTQDDDYSEKTENIINDILPGINRVEWDNFWIIPDREEAIRTAIVVAQKNDIVLIAWKWDEHVMVTNNWTIDWHDKKIVENTLKWLDDNKIL